MKYLSRAIFSSFFLFSLIICSATAGQNSEEGKIKAVEKLLNEHISNDAPGFVIGIAHKGKTVLVKAYGMADLEQNIPNTTDTVFHVASVSKQFVAFSTALLVRDGKLSLEDDIRKYLPYVPDFGSKITVRHLILHTSGIRDQWGLFGIGGQRSGNILTQAQIINVISRQKTLNYAPGSEHTYNNSGYTLLAEIIKAVSGKTLREFTTERIFTPLGMTKTFFFDDVTEIVPNRAHSYSKKEGAYSKKDGPSSKKNDASSKKDEAESNRDRASLWSRKIMSLNNVGATSLHTTAADLLKWADNFRDPIVGDKDLIKKISQMGKLDDGTDIEYGYALYPSQYAGHMAIGHSGSDAGFRANIIYFPDHELAITLTSNAGGAVNMSKINSAIAEIYLGKKETNTIIPKKIIPSEKLLDAVAGDYQDRSFEYPRPFKKVKNGIEIWGNALTFRNDGTIDKGDKARSKGLYFTPIYDDQGQVARLKESKVGKNGRKINFKKVIKVTPSPADLKQLVGDYHSDELDVTYSLFLDGDDLKAKMIWMDEPVTLSPTTKDGFSMKWYYINIQRTKKGKVTGLTISTGRVHHLLLNKIS